MRRYLEWVLYVEALAYTVRSLRAIVLRTSLTRSSEPSFKVPPQQKFVQRTNKCGQCSMLCARSDLELIIRFVLRPQRGRRRNKISSGEHPRRC